jgi:hypothetical protein
MKTRIILTIVLGFFAMIGSVPRAQADELKTVVLRIHRVKCVDECGGRIVEKLPGDDEIRLGVIAVDATGSVHMKDMGIGNFRRDGHTIPFTNPLRVVSFRVDGTRFPKLYQVALVLAETDPGRGFNEYLKKLTEHFRKLSNDKVARVAPLIGDGGMALAVFGPQVAGVIAKEIAAEVAEEVGKKAKAALKAELKDRWKDEIFQVRLQKLRIPRPSFRFHGGMTSDRKTVVFSGHKCKYELEYSWQLL